MIPLPITAIVLCDLPEHLQKQCLPSVSWCQEILLMVSEQHRSDWKKVTLPENAIIRTHPQTPITNFSEVRNQALKHANNEWVLFLDSDEVLEKNAETKIAPLLENPEVAYTFVRTDIFYGQALRFGEASRQSLVRLFRKDKGHFQRAVHEEVTIMVGYIESTDVEIEHWAHPSITQFLESVAEYAKIEGTSRNSQASLGYIWLQAAIFPKTKFDWNYWLCQGWRDGWRGLVYAVVMSLHSLAVRAFWYEKTLS